MSRSLGSIGSELTTAARVFARRPAYAGLAAALFALGIGAIATIFAVVSVTMLRPLPYRAADQLVRATSTEPAGPGERIDMALGYFQFARWRSESRAFVALEGFTPATMKLLGGEVPEPVTGALVSAGFFDLLGWRPEQGRGSAARRSSPAPGSSSSATACGATIAKDPAIVGKVIDIDEERREIVGVMPAAFAMRCSAPTPDAAATGCRSSR